jgi:hypothetical protein
MPESPQQDCTPQRQDLLVAFYKVSWDEMTWRRNAGYRTIILGLGYFGLLLVLISFNHAMDKNLRIGIAVVVAIGTLFGAGYLLSNYRKYMTAAQQTVKIEEFVGAYDANFLGALGALMPAERRERPKAPIARDIVCLWSVIAFLAGGLLTALVVVLI